MIRIRHTVVHPSLDEEAHVAEDPLSHVLELSRLKALSVVGSFESGYILGADTIVVLDGEILGKPRNRADAESMIKRLSGRLHEVYTGLTLIDAASGRQVQGHERTSVKIRRMAPAEISAYIDSGEPMDKAGSYGIQGYGAAIVERVKGCYFNVVGLPITRLLYLIWDLDKITGGK